MILGLTYSDDQMNISREKCAESMRIHGVEFIYSLKPDHIDPTFFQANKDILESPRGCGFWLWKPYTIFNVMLAMTDDDILIYSDAGIQIVGSLQPLINAMGDQEIFLFSNGWKDCHWTKMDVIDTINHKALKVTPTNSGDFYSFDGYEDYRQCQASNILIRKGAMSMRFVKEWLLYCQMPGLIDDSPSILENHPEFRDHRHDQSILTALCWKYGLKQHWFPSTTALHLRPDYPGDHYDPVFLHHRKRNSEW